jgi:fumarylacetoacetase
MTYPLDETHDPKRASWIASAQGHAEFLLQNFPLNRQFHRQT